MPVTRSKTRLVAPEVTLTHLGIHTTIEETTAIKDEGISPGETITPTHLETHTVLGEAINILEAECRLVELKLQELKVERERIIRIDAINCKISLSTKYIRC